MRSLVSLIPLLVVGCTFEDGQPWGLAEVSLEARFAPPADRLDGARLQTSGGVAVEVEALSAAFSAVVLTGAPEGVASFDPANPPPGYSMCHGGHCHHDESGNLVDVEDIALEVASEKGGGAAWVQDVAPDLLRLTDALRPVRLGPCPDACQLPRGRFVAAGVQLTRLKLVGRAFGEGLPDDGLTFTYDLVATVEVRTPVSIETGREAPIGLGLALTVDIPAELFDGVDFESTGAEARILENLQAHAVVTAAVSRFDP